MKNKLTLAVAISAFSLVMFASSALAQAPSPRVKPTLAPGRMKACETRSTALQTRLTNLIRMASNMLEVFDNHATRVKDYYTNVVAPSGKTIANYDTLVADISAKRTMVEGAWAKAKTNADAFSCTSGEVKTALNQFRLDMQATKQALRAYRTAIKNLLVAVKRVAPSPSPTSSPTP